ncbi:phenylacetate--CoA ligase family protein [Vibrio sp. IRLE0018]|uniref:phenylacetate--CoA ligase family protein n=1 Tax=Vibrio floridensis TaxID=2908007 RepID=UPI001F30B3D3|nr:phenylacetate--CoA ligase family protein [Vibrio floridensis]MCF8780052.1 phenylacetate--CoA ligase family protein [Vibrio floridensis]
MFTSKLYVKSPVWFQTLALSMRALARKKLRNNKETQEVIAELLSHDYSIDKLDSYRIKKKNEVLLNAIDNSSFYSQVSSNSLDVDKFPFMDKNLCRENASEIRSKIKPNVVVHGTTGGTTGMPLEIPQSMHSVIYEQAFISRHLQWAGFKEGDKRAWLRGDMIVPLHQTKPPFWRNSYFEDMLYLSSYHLTAQNIPSYIEAMVDYGVDIIQAYPSAISIIANYLEQNGLVYPAKLKAIITSSEKLSLHERSVISKVFGCNVFDWYGMFERVAAIANCEHGRYHLLTDYSHVEFGPLIDGANEIIGTNFNNLYFPLIRYKTGDRVLLSKEESCPCGRVYPLIDEVVGRSTDYLLAIGGNKIGSAILSFVPKGVEGLLETQFVQKTFGKVSVYAVVECGKFNSIQEEKLINNLKHCVGVEIKVEVHVVDKLTRTSSGKLKHVICEV